MQTTVAEIRALLEQADEHQLKVLERSLAADTRKGVVSALEKARRRVAAAKAERDRVAALYAYERSLAPNPDSVIVGLDEVGRGSLAGPLAVGAVVLPAEPHLPGLNDSKQVKPAARDELANVIRQVALAHAIQYVQPAYIDEYGMSASLRKAFSGALAQVEQTGLHIDAVLVDGNPLGIDPREVNVVKGDARCASIAAASIMAKSTRDALMRSLAPKYPGYGFDENKGYGSERHIAAIREMGITDIHRKSFCRSFMQESLF